MSRHWKVHLVLCSYLLYGTLPLYNVARCRNVVLNAVLATSELHHTRAYSIAYLVLVTDDGCSFEKCNRIKRKPYSSSSDTSTHSRQSQALRNPPLTTTCRLPSDINCLQLGPAGTTGTIWNRSVLQLSQCNGWRRIHIS